MRFFELQTDFQFGKYFDIIIEISSFLGENEFTIKNRQQVPVSVIMEDQ